MDLESTLGRYFWPLLFGGTAAFCYLTILAFRYARLRGLMDLLNDLTGQISRLEHSTELVYAQARLQRYRSARDHIRAVLAKEGLPTTTPPTTTNKPR